MPDKGQDNQNKSLRTQDIRAHINDFVLDKSIFSNVFDKDIKRIYIYRKCERLAKAIHLITPAFAASPSLRNRLDSVAIGLIDAAILPPSTARNPLSRELLALSSLLSVARTGALISEMNADLISREAHALLQEIASYEEPRLFMDDAPTLAELAKQVPSQERSLSIGHRSGQGVRESHKGQSIRHISDMQQSSTSSTSRQDAILEILRTKGPAYIKDISTVIRDVSEKTIQRELQSLVARGRIHRSGERRWTQYTLVDLNPN